MLYPMKSQKTLEAWLTPGLRQGKYTGSLCCPVSEDEEDPKEEDPKDQWSKSKDMGAEQEPPRGQFLEA